MPSDPFYTLMTEVFSAYDALALKGFRKLHSELQTEIKADGSAVTAIDRQASADIIATLQHHTPDYGIISEEETQVINPEAEHKWILDPLDGTSSFARGLPLWGLGIGLMKGDEAIGGYLRFPVVDEAYFCSGREIHTLTGKMPSFPSPTVETRKNILVGSDMHERLPVHHLEGYKMYNFGTHLYHITALALGRAHAAITTLCHVWDIVPALPLIHARGYIARYTDGTPFQPGPLTTPPFRLPMPLILGPKEIVNDLLEKLQK